MTTSDPIPNNSANSNSQNNEKLNPRPRPTPPQLKWKFDSLDNNKKKA